MFDIPQFKELISLVDKEKITYPDIKHYALDEINEVLDMLEKGKVTGRAIIKQE